MKLMISRFLTDYQLLALFNRSLIVSMAANPDPSKCAAGANRKRPIVLRDSDRPQLADLFEAQRRVRWISGKQCELFLGARPDLGREAIEQFPKLRDCNGAIFQARLRRRAKPFSRGSTVPFRLAAAV